MKIIVNILILVGTPLAFAAPDISVTKAVNNTFPAAGQPVEFTVELRNVGDEAASGVLVLDQLPEELAMPAGTAAFTSVGSYDPATGEWSIGDMAAGVDAVMTMPAVVVDAAPPDCIVNVAASQFPDTANDTNDEARAAVHQAGVERCVDLEVSFGISASPLVVFPTCNSEERYQGDVELINNGPDTARNVVVTIAQDPVIGPDLRFEDADCDNQPSASCRIDAVAPGQIISIDVTSDLYQSPTATEQTLTVGAATNDVDYDLTNNQPSASGVGGGFSSCDEIDLDLPGVPVGPACFIATAAYGSPLDSRLDSLRGFRDRYLISNAPGRAFLRFYYRHSPPIADYIAGRDWLRTTVRALLAPIVFAIEYPVPATLSLLALGFALFARRRKRLVVN